MTRSAHADRRLRPRFSAAPGFHEALNVFFGRVRGHEALVTVALFDTILEASLARGALEGLGIPASVPEEVTGPSSGVGGSGRTALQVFESDRERAALALRRMQIRMLEPPSEEGGRNRP